MYQNALLLILLGGLIVGCRTESTPSPSSSSDPGSDAVGETAYIHAATDLEAGRYFIIVAGCNDCHTPDWLENGPDIPEEDWLTGLPIGFRGPWGTSYPKNLRLTAQQMDEDVWVQTLHTRRALPPMPWASVNALSERDARAVYHYIRSLGPAGRPAPPIVPPDQEPLTPYFEFVPQHMERLASGTSTSRPNG